MSIPSYILKYLKEDIANEKSSSRSRSKLVYELLNAKKTNTSDSRLLNTPIFFTKEASKTPRVLTDAEVEEYITKRKNNKFTNFTAGKASQSKIVENKNLINRTQKNRLRRPVRPK